MSEQAKLARSSVTQMSGALKRHYQSTCSLQNDFALIDAINDCSEALINKIDFAEQAASIIREIDWFDFWRVINQQSLSKPVPLVDARDATFCLRLTERAPETFLLLLLESLASTVKNIGDIFAILMNSVWCLGLIRNRLNLYEVDKVLIRSAAHPALGVIHSVLADDQSWFNVARRIRNTSQHVDSTIILVRPENIRLGRTGGQAPLLDPQFYNSNESNRQLHNFCAWLEIRMYKFVSELSGTLASQPVLQ